MAGLEQFFLNNLPLDFSRFCYFLDFVLPFLVPSGLILEEETLINLTSWQELEHPVLV